MKAEAIRQQQPERRSSPLKSEKTLRADTLRVYVSRAYYKPLMSKIEEMRNM